MLSWASKKNSRLKVYSIYVFSRRTREKNTLINATESWTSSSKAFPSLINPHQEGLSEFLPIYLISFFLFYVLLNRRENEKFSCYGWKIFFRKVFSTLLFSSALKIAPGEYRQKDILINHFFGLLVWGFNFWDFVNFSMKCYLKEYVVEVRFCGFVMDSLELNNVGERGSFDGFLNLRLWNLWSLKRKFRDF